MSGIQGPLHGLLVIVTWAGVVAFGIGVFATALCGNIAARLRLQQKQGRLVSNAEAQGRSSAVAWETRTGYARRAAMTADAVMAGGAVALLVLKP